MMDVENRRLKEELSAAKKEAARWSNKYHDLWYDVKPYLDALHRAPELVRGFLEKILAPKQEHTMNVPQQNRKRGQDIWLDGRSFRKEVRLWPSTHPAALLPSPAA